MTVSALIAKLEQRGVDLEIDGDRLCWTAPTGVMTSDMVEAVRRHKPEIVAMLSAVEGDRGDVACPDAKGSEVAENVLEEGAIDGVPFDWFGGVRLLFPHRR